MAAEDRKDQRQRGEISPEDRAAIERRSAELGRRLDEARHGSDVAGVRPPASTARGEAMGRAFRVSAELIGGILAGSLIGYGLDSWLGNQKPWFFVLFFLLGAAAGIMNVVRVAMREKKTPPLPSVKDDEDGK